MAKNDDFSLLQARLYEDQLGSTMQRYEGQPDYFMGDLFYATCLAPFRKRKPSYWQRSWRERDLQQLRNVDQQRLLAWSFLASTRAVKIGSKAICTPWGVKVAQGRPCGRRHCPFCWFRKTVKPVMESVLYALHPSMQARQIRKSAHYLTIVTESHSIDPTNDVGELRSRMQLLQRLVPVGRMRETTEGLCRLWTVIPHNQSWLMRHSSLFVSRSSLRHWNARRWKVQSFGPTLGRQQILQALSGFCSFPREWLTIKSEAQATQLAILEEASHGLRLRSGYGALRNRSARTRRKKRRKMTEP